jgi:hypothetical protein
MGYARQAEAQVERALAGSRLKAEAGLDERPLLAAAGAEISLVAGDRFAHYLRVELR